MIFMSNGLNKKVESILSAVENKWNFDIERAMKQKIELVKLKRALCITIELGWNM